MITETVTLDTYESLVDYARRYSESLDDLRWVLGDIANTVTTRYGDKTVESFARDIGQRKSTIYQYSRMASFYSPDLRRRILSDMPNINYSHMRDGLRLGGDPTTAYLWLQKVSDNGWTADEASHKLTERLGHETRESTEGQITDRFITPAGGFITIRIEHVQEWIPGMTVTLKKGK